MALRGHVFNKQLFSSECFALFINTFLDNNSGIVKGCELSNTANSIDIGSGYFCIKGRFCQEEGGTSIPIESTEGTDIYCRFVCEIDMSQENTTSELNQATYKILQSTKDYPTLQQEDITDEGTIYQFEFAQFKVTEQGIEDFVDTRKYLDFNSIYAGIRNMLNNLNTDAEKEITALITDLKKFCDTTKEILDDNVAVNLLNLINANMPKIEIITLETNNWTQNEETGYYEYTIENENVNRKYLVSGFMNLANQEKMTSGYTQSIDSGYKIITSEKPDNDEGVEMQVVIQKVVDDNEEAPAAGIIGMINVSSGSGSGSGLVPSNVKNLRIKTSNEALTVFWEDPRRYNY